MELLEFSVSDTTALTVKSTFLTRWPSSLGKTRCPIANAVSLFAEWLNRLQLLTIRQDLSLVFVALVGLLLVVSIWP